VVFEAVRVAMGEPDCAAKWSDSPINRGIEEAQRREGEAAARKLEDELLKTLTAGASGKE
jgi:hypothetical protein